MEVAAVNAQSLDSNAVLGRANQLSSAGEYGDVVTLLEPYLEEHPSSAEAWLLLAQHRYWSGDVEGACRAYDDALEHHATDTSLRLAYARFLLENDDARAAVDILKPFGNNHAEAEAVRGTEAWWSGDLLTAARHFRNALAADPEHEQAASSLAAIRASARPWARLHGEYASDTQPLSHKGISAEAGFFVTPLHTLRAEVWNRRFTIESIQSDQPGPGIPNRPAESASTHAAVTTASIVSNKFWPRVRLESDAAAGVFAHPNTTTWTGHLDAAIRLPYGMLFGGRVARSPYLYTVASMTESVITESVEARLEFDRSRWLGEAFLGIERFQDDNTKQTAYAWLMAPLVSQKWTTLQAGYAFSYQNTAQHRFTPVMLSAPRPGQPATWGGRYDPYHTPLNTNTHSVTGSLGLLPAGALSLHVNGSYGFAGFEKAPYVYVSNGAPIVDEYRHQIHPWSIRASLDAPIGSSLTLKLEWSHMATTWYDASAVDLSAYLRF